MLKFMNIFHNLQMMFVIKDFEQHLILYYHVYLHKYTQEGMEFLDISLPNATY